MDDKVILGSGRKLGSTKKIASENNEWLLTVSEKMILNYFKLILKNCISPQICFLPTAFCLFVLTMR